MAGEYQTPVESILGGIGAGLEGYYTGRMEKQKAAQDLAESKAQTSYMGEQTHQMKMNEDEKSFGYMQAMFRADPNRYSHDQNFIRSVNEHGASLGVHYDPAQGIGPEFGKIEPPDPNKAAMLALEDRRFEHDNLQRFSTDFGAIMSKNLPPSVKIANLQLSANANGIDEQTFHAFLQKNGLVAAMRDEWSTWTNETAARLNALRASTGVSKAKSALDYARINQINAMAPYQAALNQARLDHLATWDQRMKEETKQRNATLDFEYTKFMNHVLEYSSNNKYRDGATRRADAKAALDAAEEQRKTAYALMIYMSQNGASMTDEQKQAAQAAVNKYAANAENLVNASGSIAAGGNALPPSAPSNWTPSGQQPQQSSGLPQPGSISHVISGPNAGKVVYATKDGKYMLFPNTSDPNPPPGVPYQPNALDQLQPGQ